MGQGYRKPPVLAMEDLGLELGSLRGHLSLVHDAVKSLAKDPIVVTGFEELLAAQKGESCDHSQ